MTKSRATSTTAYIDIKPLGTGRVFVTECEAIDAAIKGRRSDQFKASRRRGYWRVDVPA